MIFSLNNISMIKYIEVNAKMTTEGKVIPFQIIWDNDKVFDIDRVIDIRPLASTKGGGVGIRYLCKIKGKEKILFLSEYKWFIEYD